MIQRATSMKSSALLVIAAILALVSPAFAPAAHAQSFNFERIHQQARDYTVILDMKITFSFGMQTNEQEERALGTIVSEDGLIIFDGTSLSQGQTFASISGMNIKTDPTRIEISTLDDKKYTGEFLGVDRFTRLGFIRITDADGRSFKPVSFARNVKFRVGEWLAAHMLLPEFVRPPIAGDVGMVSSLLTDPEAFPLTVGFNQMEMACVLYNENLQAVGLLGILLNPSSANTDPAGLLDSFNEFEMPLLGVITGERLEKMIADPPVKGKTERAWLGISLQALTPDLAEFFGISVPGGIIVNNIIANSPAEEAGLKVGDVIYELNGEPIAVDRDERIPVFQRTVAEMGPGTSVEMAVFRTGENQVDTLHLIADLRRAPLAATEADEFKSEDFEFTVRNMVFADFLINNLDADSFQGAVVSELERGGLAAIGGLRLGDIIQRVGETPITSVTDVQAVMETVGADKPSEVVFFVWRNSRTLFVNVKTDWE